MTEDELTRLAWRAKELVEGLWERQHRLADKADFLASFKHELYGTDEKKGRRAQLRETRNYL